MVKNLNQLKKTIKKGTCLEILVHCRPEFTGQKRRVTMANTQGFYSIVPDEPEHKVSLAMMERDLFSGGVVPPTGSFMTTSAVSTAKAKNIPIISEIELAGRYTDAKMVCITGSNGKPPPPC